MGWDQVGALGTLGCLLVAVITLIFVIKPLPWRKSGEAAGESVGDRGVSRKLIAFLVVVIAIAFILSGVSIWAAWHHDPLRFPHPTITEEITDRVFANERVRLDARKYRHCTFTNVTFVYDGTGPVILEDSTINGTWWVDTESDAVGTTAKLLKGLGMLKDNIPYIADPHKYKE